MSTTTSGVYRKPGPSGIYKSSTDEKQLKKRAKAKIVRKLQNDMKPKEGTVDFLNVNILKKNSVRGLLRKRAKQYECRYLSV